MKSKVWTIALLTVATVGGFSLPSKADEATVQQCSQDIVITGNDNYAEQGCTQVNVNQHQGRRTRRDNSARVQTGNQGVDILGDGNSTYQNINQLNIEQQRERAARARRYYRR
jgi:hypothetical protein